MMEELDDYELIYMIRQNDETAYRLLFEKYNRALWHQVYAEIRRFQSYHGDPSELYSECLCSFHSHVQDYRMDMKTKFGTYIYTATQFSLRNYIAKSLNTHRHEIYEEKIFEEYQAILEDHDASFSPVEQLKSATLKEILNKELQQMSEEEKIIFLGYLDGRNLDEISAYLNISKRRVQYRIKKLKERIKTTLIDNDYN